ncbi:MAG: hypothetical protein Greene041662_177 [Candidatus Peregrinibacteria bacterium Greene0416_62]|nr:MAG: hypothetical protein Greene041662_177 [Candidatus Peregrinibacteria bacterium Greene0416_62]
MSIHSILSDGAQAIAQTRVGEAGLDFLNAADNVTALLRQGTSRFRQGFGNAIASTGIGRAVGDCSIAAAYRLAGLDGKRHSSKQ